MMLSFVARGALRQLQCPSALSGVGVDGGFLNLQLNLLMLPSTKMLVDPFFFFIFSSDNSPVLKETNYTLIMKVK